MIQIHYRSTQQWFKYITDQHNSASQINDSATYYLLLSSSCVKRVFLTITELKTGVFIRSIAGFDSRTCWSNKHKVHQKWHYTKKLKFRNCHVLCICHFISFYSHVWCGLVYFEFYLHIFVFYIIYLASLAVEYCNSCSGSSRMLHCCFSFTWMQSSWRSMLTVFY